jgi:hypothetical protein
MLACPPNLSCGAPAGIELATPSLPFVLPRTCDGGHAGQRDGSVRG